jgi:hypothetical protein
MGAGAATGVVAARVDEECGGTWVRKGLSALEVVPLELAIRALGNGKQGRCGKLVIHLASFIRVFCTFKSVLRSPRA